MESLSVLHAAHADRRTRVFADPATLRIICVFDFLSAGNDATGWGQFNAQMEFKRSRKLNEWSNLNEWSGQTEFANFLEDHLEDVNTPSGSELLAIATDLEASAAGSFRGRVNLNNGSVALRYQNEVETTVEVPAKLTLAIPLFEHGDLYRLPARLRFNVGASGVKFRILLTNLDDAIQTEFERIVQDLEAKIGNPIVRGSVSLPW